MNYKVLPLIKSHFSIGKSIITLDEPSDKKGKPVKNSAFNILIENKLDTLILVEDNVSGLLEASQNAKKNNIKLIFGVRISINNDMELKSDENLSKKAKYVIFLKNLDGYKDLIKIWTKAATDGFYYEPTIDFKNLKKLWNEKNLKLVIPFYDSFLQKNILESHKHVPEIDFTTPAVFIEENGLPFDYILQKRAKEYAVQNNFPLQETQSIYYRSKDDFTAYLTFRCINNKTDLDKPNLEHMCSDQFSFDKWLSIK